jgi:hypothetical protein
MTPRESERAEIGNTEKEQTERSDFNGNGRDVDKPRQEKEYDEFATRSDYNAGGTMVTYQRRTPIRLSNIKTQVGCGYPSNMKFGDDKDDGEKLKLMLRGELALWRMLFLNDNTWILRKSDWKSEQTKRS